MTSNENIQESILGAIMLERSAYNRVSKLLRPEFFSDANGCIYKAAIDLAEVGTPIDLLSLTNQLRKNGALDDAGGAFKVTMLTQTVSSSANIEFHAVILAEHYYKKTLGYFCAGIEEKTKNDKEDVFSLIDLTLEHCFKTIEAVKSFKGTLTLPEALNGAITQIREAEQSDGNIVGVPTGSPELDHVTGGLRKTNLIILAARPAMGKSALMLNWCITAAKNGYSVYMVNLEMSIHQMIVRMLASEGLISMSKLTTGRGLDSADWEKIERAKAELEKLPITIEDNSMANIHDIRSGAQKHKLKHGELGLIAVDYLQLMSLPRGNFGNREGEVSYNSRQLKLLAKDLEVPVLVLSQLSRRVEQRPEKRPILSDLRESGAIEQDADIIMAIYRPSVYFEFAENCEEYSHLEQEEYKRISELLILKNRNGFLQKVVQYFDGQFARFVEFEQDFTQFTDF